MAFAVSEQLRYFVRQVVHWGALLLVVRLLFLSDVQHFLRAEDDGFVIIYLFGLASILAGAYLDWKMALFGLFLIFSGVFIAFLDDNALLLAVGGAALIAVLVTAIVWIRYHQNSEPPRSRFDIALARSQIAALCQKTRVCHQFLQLPVNPLEACLDLRFQSLHVSRRACKRPDAGSPVNRDRSYRSARVIPTVGRPLGRRQPRQRPPGRGAKSMYIVSNRVPVAMDWRDQFEQRFRERAGQVEQQQGFVRMEVMRPDTDGAPYVVQTAWQDRAAFEAWLKSEDFKAAHRNPLPKDAYDGEGRLEAFEVIINVEAD